jgi:hypothetical protein
MVAFVVMAVARKQDLRETRMRHNKRLRDQHRRADSKKKHMNAAAMANRKASAAAAKKAEKKASASSVAKTTRDEPFSLAGNLVSAASLGATTALKGLGMLSSVLSAAHKFKKGIQPHPEGKASAAAPPRRAEVKCRDPSAWEEAKDPRGKTYYVNAKLGATSWTKPPAKLKVGWHAAKDPHSTRVYYFHDGTGETSWVAIPDDGSWACTNCTLENTRSATACKVCGAGKVPKGKWACPQCTAHNECGRDVVCCMCGCVGPESVGKAQKDSGSAQKSMAGTVRQAQAGASVQRSSALSERAEAGASFFSELVHVAPLWMFKGRSVGAALFKGAAGVYKPEVEEETVVELGGAAWMSSALDRRGVGGEGGGVVLAEAVSAVPMRR